MMTEKNSGEKNWKYFHLDKFNIEKEHQTAILFNDNFP